MCSSERAVLAFVIQSLWVSINLSCKGNLIAMWYELRCIVVVAHMMVQGMGCGIAVACIECVQGVCSVSSGVGREYGSNIGNLSMTKYDP